MERIFDPIRKKWVALTPEEKVRQNLLQQMLSVGYPKSSLIVEVDLSHLMRNASLPNRRVDILCGKFFEQTFHPLLVAECKKGRWNKEAQSQVEGYCALVSSPFFLLADSEKVETYLLDDNAKANKIASILPFSSLLQIYRDMCDARIARSS